jgi:hypothetical protein
VPLDEVPEDVLASFLKLVHPALIAGFANLIEGRRKWISETPVLGLHAVLRVDDLRMPRDSALWQQLAAPFGRSMLVAAWSLRAEGLPAEDAAIHE